VRVEKTNTYKLNIALRNRANVAVAVPALELSLTDAQGKLMARRVLRTTDFGVTPSSVPAGRELSLQATLQTAFATANNEPQEAVAGYTIELFYP
jgi:G:T/U-mismatch repair DNA glycosylase